MPNSSKWHPQIRIININAYVIAHTCLKRVQMDSHRSILSIVAYRLTKFKLQYFMCGHLRFPVRFFAVSCRNPKPIIK